MILTQSPLRISFFGGGSDLPAYLEKYGNGKIFSCTINRYVQAMVKARCDKNIVIAYSQLENVENIDQLQHNLVRESLKKLGLSRSLEIHTIGDIHGSGSGLGSSAATTAAVLLALAEFQNRKFTESTLIAMIKDIEAKNNPHVGIQDILATIYGSANVYELEKERYEIKRDHEIWKRLKQYEHWFILLDTGLSRESKNILAEVTDFEVIKEGVELVEIGLNLLRDKKIFDFAKVLSHAWELKKNSNKSITNETIQSIEKKAKKYGALGLKLCGAGGGGFMLCIVEPKLRGKFIQDMGLRELKFKFSIAGTKLLYQRE